MTTKQNKLKFGFVLLLTLVCAVALHGQSGRRKVPAAPPAEIPTPTPEPTPKPEKSEKESDLAFFVGTDQNGAFASYPLGFYLAALDGCADKLRKGSSARVEMTEREFTRGDAIKKAKGETITLVVLLKVTSRTMGGSDSYDYNQLAIQYTVFSPGTAKIAVNGTSYLNANRKGPLVVSPPAGSNSRVYIETLLKQAGEDAGERILRALHIGSQI